MEQSAVNAGARTGEWNRNIYAWFQATGPFPIGICFRMSPVAGGCGGGYFFDYDAMDDIYVKLTQAVLPEDILRYTQEMGDWMYENFNVIPMFFLNPQVAFDPDVVQTYQANHLHFGPVRHHEFTQPVYKLGLKEWSVLKIRPLRTRGGLICFTNFIVLTQALLGVVERCQEALST